MQLFYTNPLYYKLYFGKPRSEPVRSRGIRFVSANVCRYKVAPLHFGSQHKPLTQLIIIIRPLVFPPFSHTSIFLSLSVLLRITPPPFRNLCPAARLALPELLSKNLMDPALPCRRNQIHLRSPLPPRSHQDISTNGKFRMLLFSSFVDGTIIICPPSLGTC